MIFEFDKDENKCCGWTNVFDYCSSVAVLEIALRAMSYHEMMKIYYDLNNPENSVDYGIDSNYDLDYIGEDYELVRRKRSMTSWEIRSSLRNDHVNSFLLTGYFSQRKKPVDLGPGAGVGVMNLPGMEDYSPDGPGGPDDGPDYGPGECDNCFENTFDCDSSPANCACSNLFDYEPFYADMECYTDPSNGTVVVGDVCDGDICHLNGCGDGIISIINEMKWLFGSLFISYNLFFFIHLYRKCSMYSLTQESTNCLVLYHSVSVRGSLV